MRGDDLWWLINGLGFTTTLSSPWGRGERPPGPGRTRHRRPMSHHLLSVCVRLTAELCMESMSGALVLLTTSLMNNGLATDTSLHCCKISCEQHYCRSLKAPGMSGVIGRERGSVRMRPAGGTCIGCRVMAPAMHRSHSSAPHMCTKLHLRVHIRLLVVTSSDQLTDDSPRLYASTKSGCRHYRAWFGPNAAERAPAVPRRRPL
jgi:hypothetical protein